MIETVIVVALAGVLWGWLWCSPDAHLLDPIRHPLMRLTTKPYEVPVDPPTTLIESWTNAARSIGEAFGTDSPDRILREGRGWQFIRDRLSCPVCMGFDATVAAAFMLGWQGWPSVAIVAAANGAHVAWMSWLNREDS
jgi:hypothetical protein